MSFPQPNFVNLPNLRMAIYQQGEGAPTIPPVILCHGFPEIAFSWRHQLPAIALAGFRAIAPDMRGYGKTGIPKNAQQNKSDIHLYDMTHLTGDLIALLDQLEIEKAIFCGHDWGGIVIWDMPFRYPDRVAGLIGVNTPFMPPSQHEPISSLRHIFGEDNYIVVFQKYDSADKILEADIAKAMRFFYRKGPSRKDYDSLPKERRGHSFIKAFQSENEFNEKPATQ